MTTTDPPAPGTLTPDQHERVSALRAAIALLGTGELSTSYIEVAAYVLTGATDRDTEVAELRHEAAAAREERDRFHTLARRECDRATTAVTEAAHLRAAGAGRPVNVHRPAGAPA